MIILSKKKERERETAAVRGASHIRKVLQSETWSLSGGVHR